MAQGVIWQRVPTAALHAMRLQDGLQLGFSSSTKSTDLLQQAAVCGHPCLQAPARGPQWLL